MQNSTNKGQQLINDKYTINQRQNTQHAVQKQGLTVQLSTSNREHGRKGENGV